MPHPELHRSLAAFRSVASGPGLRYCVVRVGTCIVLVIMVCVPPHKVDLPPRPTYKISNPNTNQCPRRIFSRITEQYSLYYCHVDTA
eukprot:2933996-Rhodomonas_salina.2